MDKQDSSREKPTTKAGSPNRSTTSSTTASTTGDATPVQAASETSEARVVVPRRSRRDPPQLLSHDQQELFLDCIARGNSPALACEKLNLYLNDVYYTRHVDAEFGRLWREIKTALAENVEMSAYSTAMKGTATAQTLYLKHQPPPGWGEAANRPLRGDNFEECTDAELVELATKIGTHLPPEFTEGIEPPGDEKIPGSISPAELDRE